MLSAFVAGAAPITPNAWVLRMLIVYIAMENSGALSFASVISTSSVLVDDWPVPSSPLSVQTIVYDAKEGSRSYAVVMVTRRVVESIERWPESGVQSSVRETVASGNSGSVTVIPGSGSRVLSWKQNAHNIKRYRV